MFVRGLMSSCLCLVLVGRRMGVGGSSSMNSGSGSVGFCCTGSPQNPPVAKYLVLHSADVKVEKHGKV